MLSSGTPCSEKNVSQYSPLGTLSRARGTYTIIIDHTSTAAEESDASFFVLPTMLALSGLVAKRLVGV